MKKIICILLSLVIIFIMNFGTNIYAFAEYDTVKAAYNITSGETVSLKFNSYETEKYLKFVAPSTEVYEFTALNPYGNKKTTFEVFTKNHKYNESSAYTDENNKEIYNYTVYFSCKKGVTYYISVKLRTNKDYSLNFCVSKHKHTNKTINKVKATYNAVMCNKSYSFPDGIMDIGYSPGYYEYRCTKCGHENTKSIPAPTKYVCSPTYFVYDGKSHKPSVKIKDEKGNVVASSNYSVSYPKGRKNVGSYKIKITFKGSKYKGKAFCFFQIKPKSATVSKLNAGKKKFTIRWKKQTTQTTGYQIQYAADSKFTKNKKIINIKNNKTTSKTISKLKSKKKYYVRIRTYKTIKVNGSSKKIYSSWSKAKAVTTKK